MGRGFAIGETGRRVHQLLRELERLVVIHVIDHKLLLALTQSLGNGVSQSCLILRVYLQTVYHCLYRVVLVAVEFHSGRNLFQVSIDSDRQISFFSYCFE